MPLEKCRVWGAASAWGLIARSPRMVDWWTEHPGPLGCWCLRPYSFGWECLLMEGVINSTTIISGRHLWARSIISPSQDGGVMDWALGVLWAVGPSIVINLNGSASWYPSAGGFPGHFWCDSRITWVVKLWRRIRIITMKQSVQGLLIAHLKGLGALIKDI